jgi:TatD DNase family protein
VVAIGEIGLDYYRERTPIALQRSIFLEQLGLAEEFGLPVIIHNRDASDDILNILHLWYRNLEKINPKLASYPGVLHSFSGDLNLANVMISHNFKLGVAGPITFKKKSVLQSIVGAVPIESLLIETDAPYLTPHPYRGKRNEPANVRIVAEVIAEIIQQPVDKFANITTGEADKLFRWREIN